MEVWGGNQAADNGVSMAGIDAWVLGRPFQNAEGGGDVHYVSSCATGRITRVLLADVSGHGPTVSGVARSLRDLMRRYINFVDQSRLVKSLNKEFNALADAGNFATAVVATYFSPTGCLTICNAGHPRPLLFSAKDRAWRVLDAKSALGVTDHVAANIPLGIADGVHYDQLTIRLRRGDLLLLYTDALVEAKDGANNLLGERGLLDLVRGIDPTEPPSFLQTLLTRIEAPAGPLCDDATLLLLRPNGLAPQVTIGEMLGAFGRFLRLVYRRVRGDDALIPWPEISLVNIGGAILKPLNRLWGGKPDGSLAITSTDGESKSDHTN